MQQEFASYVLKLIDNDGSVDLSLEALTAIEHIFYTHGKIYACILCLIEVKQIFLPELSTNYFI